MQGKDIVVVRLLVEYSSLRDFGPHVYRSIYFVMRIF
jgi:hypothetical protein